MTQTPETVIVGVDCAADWKNVGVALAVFRDGRLTITEARTCKKSDPAKIIAEWLSAVPSAVIALDAPLGWPAPMGPALATHVAGARLPAGKRGEFFNRSTDLHIRERFGKKPLEVGANLIAHTAHSAITLLNDLRSVLGAAIPLSWTAAPPDGVVAIEVYPAVTRIGHRIACEGNRLSDLPAGVGLPAALADDCGVDHVRDAVLCAIAAGDFCAGRATPPADLELARREGWIWAAGDGPLRKRKAR